MNNAWKWKKMAKQSYRNHRFFLAKNYFDKKFGLEFTGGNKRFFALAVKVHFVMQ